MSFGEKVAEPPRPSEALLRHAVRVAVAKCVDEMDAARDRRIAAMLARGILIEAT